MSFSKNFQEHLIQGLFNATTISVPNTISFGLLTTTGGTAINAAEDNIIEITSSNNYSRVSTISGAAIQNNATTWNYDSTTGKISNAIAIEFVDAQGGDWPDSKALGVFITTSNDLFCYAKFASDLVIKEGMKPVFDPGDIEITLT
jgi:hypothetical protein